MSTDAAQIESTETNPGEQQNENNSPTEGGETEKKKEKMQEIKETSPAATTDDNNETETIALRFVFANRDGLHVTVECKPTDTVGEVKALLLSMWPDELPEVKGNGDERLRLICMGKGLLMPNSRTLRDCEVPQFKTHATPINVSIRPENIPLNTSKDSGGGGSGSGGSGRGSGGNRNSTSGSTSNSTATAGCCVIL